jgi:hypothetical protein
MGLVGLAEAVPLLQGRSEGVFSQAVKAGCYFRIIAAGEPQVMA